MRNIGHNKFPTGPSSDPGLLSDIANMDQTGSSFIIDDGKTYDSKGSKDVWCKSGQSGLDKRQCKVQLTVFEDEVPRIKLIFRGK